MKTIGAAKIIWADGLILAQDPCTVIIKFMLQSVINSAVPNNVGSLENTENIILEKVRTLTQQLPESRNLKTR
mgnify:CR=1 FL=1